MVIIYSDLSGDSSFHKILVEKKTPLNHEAKQMLYEIQNYLKISQVTNVRVLNGYIVSGVSEDTFQKSKYAVFAEFGQDVIYDNIPIVSEAEIYTTEYLPGQYDQRADFAMQLLQILSTNEHPQVRTFRSYILSGQISSDNVEKIKCYFINPVEMREISSNAPKIVNINTDNPSDTITIEGFITFNDEHLLDCKNQYNISMSLENLIFCKDYFASKMRNPTLTELKILDTYWSDHCRHSTFLTTIEKVEIEKNKLTKGLEKAVQMFEEAKSFVYEGAERPLCLMDIATMEMKKMLKSGALNDLEISDEVNACSIEVVAEIDGKPEDYLIMFKNETHNHPTEMEPFGGASTCLGGAIRDPLSGRAHVYGAIRLTGCADPRESYENTLQGKLPQRKITKIAADGYSSYGNQIGLASGHLLEIYDEGFKAKRMECGALIGAVPKKNIIRQKPKPFDVIVLLGGNTGRDGLGGATGSSKDQDEDALEKGGAEVQKGNPIIERNIVRLFRKPEVSKLIKKCNDFGAGGVSVAVGEMADGLLIDLDKVPLKYSGLDGTEIAISESQERMAVLLDAADLDAFCAYAAEENLNAVKIAEVTDTNNMIMMWGGKEIANISREFLNSGGIRQKTTVNVTAPKLNIAIQNKTNIKELWLEKLADLNTCSKKGIASRFDTTSGNCTVFMPFGGKYQRTPEQGLAMKLPLIKGKTNFGTLMTVGYNASLGYESPFHSAMYAVIESVMKICAMGGDYAKIHLTFQEYFESLRNSPEKWGKPYAAMMGAFLAQEELGIPSIGGKDSMSGTFQDISVPPSLISFAVCTVDTTKLVSRSFKEAGHTVVLVKAPMDESGLPDFGILKQNMNCIHKLAQAGCISAASVVNSGGIAGCITEMSLGNEIGFKFDADFKGDIWNPNYCAMILEVNEIKKIGDLDHDILGFTIEEKLIKIEKSTISLDEALAAWEKTLKEVFPTKFLKNIDVVEDYISKPNHNELKPKVHKEKPKVLIPIFPGTNGEYEMERQFTKTFAEVETVLFKNQSASDIEESFELLEAAIKKADILAIPSGYSAGSEPDGSAKLITLILAKPRIRECINELLNARKGLIIGLGEGFKALVKTGLIETGNVVEDHEGKILMTKSPLNQYHSDLVNCKIVQASSPWLTGLLDTVSMVPVSALEGSVYIEREDLKVFMEKGQIVSLYTDDRNPFGSSYAIEGMMSESGQVIGRMACVDRLEDGLYINVFKASDCAMFKNAVQYFRN